MQASNACMLKEHDYRLERWIAALLFLLFFLPFVASADEILFTDLFHGDEIKAKSGDNYLALVCNENDDRCVLHPVKIQVTPEYHPVVDAEHERTGKRVSATGVETSYLLRSEHLVAG